MSEVIFTAPASGLYSYNEEIFFELSKGDKYVGLPKVQLDALRVRVDELEKENQKLKEALEIAREALNIYSSDLDIEICEACSECVSDLYLVEPTLPDLEPEDFGHRARQALSKLRDLGIVKEGEK